MIYVHSAKNAYLVNESWNYLEEYNVENPTNYGGY